jgi:hypothetical protein
MMSVEQGNAQVQLQAHYHHCGEAASEKCLSAATFVSLRRTGLKMIVWADRLSYLPYYLTFIA